jgi:hypothetical protein
MPHSNNRDKFTGIIIPVKKSLLSCCEQAYGFFDVFF